MEAHPRFVSARRILETVFPGEKKSLRLADLGCLEGGYAVEFARMGFEVLGIEVREANIAACNYVKSKTNLPNPASFMLVGAMNPCPCGYYGDPFKECKCSSGEISRYHKRISGPLLDRIDMFVDVPHIDYEKLTEDRPGEGSDKVRGRVKAAHEIQLERFQGRS